MLADAGDYAKIGGRTGKSRIVVGVYRESADSAVFSRYRLESRFFRIADFQRSCWEIIRWMAGFPQTPTPCAGVYARIALIRRFSRKDRDRRVLTGHVTVLSSACRRGSACGILNPFFFLTNCLRWEPYLRRQFVGMGAMCAVLFLRVRLL